MIESCLSQNSNTAIDASAALLPWRGDSRSKARLSRHALRKESRSGEDSHVTTAARGAVGTTDQVASVQYPPQLWSDNTRSLAAAYSASDSAPESWSTLSFSRSSATLRTGAGVSGNVSINAELFAGAARIATTVPTVTSPSAATSRTHVHAANGAIAPGHALENAASSIILLIPPYSGFDLGAKTEPQFWPHVFSTGFIATNTATTATNRPNPAITNPVLFDFTANPSVHSALDRSIKIPFAAYN